MNHTDLSDDRRLVRARDLFTFDGLSPSARDREVRAGRYPPPVRLSTDPKSRAVGWPLCEVLARQRALVAGKDDDQLRALIADLVAARKVAA